MQALSVSPKASHLSHRERQAVAASQFKITNYELQIPPHPRKNIVGTGVPDGPHRSTPENTPQGPASPTVRTAAPTKTHRGKLHTTLQGHGGMSPPWPQHIHYTTTGSRLSTVFMYKTPVSFGFTNGYSSICTIFPIAKTCFPCYIIARKGDTNVQVTNLTSHTGSKQHNRWK